MTQQRSLARSLIPTLVLVALLLTGGYWALNQHQKLLTQRIQQISFERSVAVQQLFEQLRVDALSSKASALAENQAFVAYIVQALNLGALPDSATDVSSVSDLLGERAQQLGLDVAAVIDDSGRVLASSDGSVQRGQNIDRNALLDQIVDSSTPMSTVLPSSSDPVLAVLTPMRRGGLFDGFLLTGLRIDGDMLQDLAQAAATEVSLLQRNRGDVVLRFSNSPPSLQAQLPALVTEHWSTVGEPTPLVDIGATSLHLRQLFAAEQLVLAYNLPEETTQAAVQKISQPLLYAFGGGALVIALWLIWLWRQPHR